jgi:threonine/homoserine/homoserine lactone efflux protein
MTVLTVVTLAVLGYMILLGGKSVLDDPNWDTLWLSVIGAALLTFIAYQATKK